MKSHPWHARPFPRTRAFLLVALRSRTDSGFGSLTFQRPSAVRFVDNTVDAMDGVGCGSVRYCMTARFVGSSSSRCYEVTWSPIVRHARSPPPIRDCLSCAHWLVFLFMHDLDCAFRGLELFAMLRSHLVAHRQACSKPPTHARLFILRSLVSLSLHA